MIGFVINKQEDVHMIQDPEDASKVKIRVLLEQEG